MAISRRVNFQSQARLDLNDLRSLESATSNDFDVVFQGLVTGQTQGYILRGFEISMSGAIGGAASALNLLVNDAAVIHVAASQSGSILQTPVGSPPQQLNSATNSIIDGAFVPSAINFIGIDYERYADAATSSTVYIWSPASESESSKVAPRGIILRYRVKISTSGFAPNVLPIATVQTDSGGNVMAITDARYMLFSLVTGGANPSTTYQYAWPQGRSANPVSSSSNSIDPFSGGDKAIGTLRDWMSAVMTSLQEINGGVSWFTQSSSGSLASIRQDVQNTIVTGNSTITHSKLAAGQINWQSNPTGNGQLHLKVVGTRLDYKIAENALPGSAVTLATNQIAYITLTRGATIAPYLSYIVNISANTTAVTSIGVVAWTTGLMVGDFLKAASDTDTNYYAIASIDSTTQVTLTGQYNVLNQTVSGVQSVYAYGTYTLPASTGTVRDIVIADRSAVPVGQNVVWLLFRSDDGGSVPRVYVKFLGAELSQGESEDVSGPQLKNVLQYIGSPVESATAPQYVSSFYPGSVQQVVSATFGAGSTLAPSEYFFLDSAARQYYVWYKVDNAGTDPKVPGTNALVEVDVTSSMTATQVAAATALALNATYYNDFSAVQSGATLTIANVSAGSAGTPSNFNMGAPFAIAQTTTGTGQGNYIIADGASLTLSLKKLDIAIGSLTASLNAPNYVETISVLPAGATPPNSVNGPISVGTSLSLPNNSRLSGVQQLYTVGKGVLKITLNGQVQILGQDFTESGVAGSSSNAFIIQRKLLVTDILTVRIDIGGGGGGGGGGGQQGPQGNPGIQGPPGQNAAGGPISISVKTGNYTALNTDCFIKIDCTSGAIIITLPAAASATGRIFYIKKIDLSTNALTVAANGSETIDGQNTQTTVTQYMSFSVISDGSGWNLF